MVSVWSTNSLCEDFQKVFKMPPLQYNSVNRKSNIKNTGYFLDYVLGHHCYHHSVGQISPKLMK